MSNRDQFEIDARQLGRPDGHVPSTDGWAEDHILCALCHVQVWESVFFLEPCSARLTTEERHDS